MKKGDSVAFHGEHGEKRMGRIVGEQPGCGCGYWIIESGGKHYCRAKSGITSDVGLLPVTRSVTVATALEELTDACRKLPANDGRLIGLLPIIERAEKALGKPADPTPPTNFIDSAWR